MDRREFLNKGLLTAGGVLIGKDIAWADAFREIKAGLPQKEADSQYDLLIDGAGLSACFLALEAARQGMKVLVTDKRTSPGYELAAKKRLWLETEGIEAWDKGMLDLFFPVREQEESDRTSLGAPRKSRQENELLLFAGSLKKGLLRTLLVNGIDVLLMTDVCGIMTDTKNQVCGAVLAMKQGLFSVSCRQFVDATDQNLFTRQLFKLPCRITDAAFVLELDNVASPAPRSLDMAGIGLRGDSLSLHPGKKAEDQYFAEYHFRPAGESVGEIEQEARMLIPDIGRKIRHTDMSLAHARIRQAALECSIHLDRGIDTKGIRIGRYHFFGPDTELGSCKAITELREGAARTAARLKSVKPTPGVEAKLYYPGGCIPYTQERSSFLEEAGKTTPLLPFSAASMTLETLRSRLAVAGTGTAGAMAALSACESKIPTLAIEYFNDLGGTKTVGGVHDFYRGYQEHRLIQEQKAALKELEDEIHTVTTLTRSLYYLNSLRSGGARILNGAILCGAECSGKRLLGLVACVNGRLLRIAAELTIDATGDGAVAAMAGEGCQIGDTRMGITQDFSQWDIPFRPKIKNYHRDYDIINATEVLECQRGLYLSHYEAHFYDFYPMQAIRESRRMESERMLDLRDVAGQRTYPDTIAQARSDYDPHYFSNTEVSRCGFLLPHFDNGAPVNIPYRAIVPKHIDGLLLSGKAIGLSYMALQFTRMSADVTVLGYVTGLAAGAILRQGCTPREFNVFQLQQDLAARGYLPQDLSVPEDLDNERIVNGLSREKDEWLISCCTSDREKILPLLQKAYARRQSLTIAKALSWFGSDEGDGLLCESLQRFYREEQLEGHPADYYEVYDGTINYWQINSLIALLGLSGTGKCKETIRQILEESGAGGDIVVAQDAYNAERIDLRLVPCYNRLINLSFYIERNPDPVFIKGLERLLEDPLYKGSLTKEYQEARHRLYKANLELLIADAAGRCGSRRGLTVLAGYLDDQHSDFRRFCHRELCSILKKDLGFDTAAWKKYIADARISVTPLRKAIEY